MRTFVDLPSGWRLTAITPLKDIQNDIAAAPAQGLTIELKGTTIGFERSVYAVTRRGLAWQQAVRTVNGKESPAPAPEKVLFAPSKQPRLVRLLFLTRASEQNYNSAVLTARTVARMTALTEAVRANPDAACVETADAGCTFIPAGVAARPEKPDGKGGFIPAL